jgi:hypothetical protein
LVTKLDRDSEGVSSRILADAFRGQRGFDVRLTCLVISASAEDGVAEAEASGEAGARRLALARAADLVLWGEIADAEDRVIRVWFTAPGEATAFGRDGWPIGRGRLPEGFDREFAAML